MKLATIALSLLLSLSAGFSQIPQAVSTARWIFPGSPRIMSMASTAKDKATKQVWFTEKDSVKIGTMLIPKLCGPAVATEYNVYPFVPSKITYVEKAFTVADTGKKKPAKYKPQVWYIDGVQTTNNQVTGTASLYALIPPAKGAGTVGTQLFYSFPTIPINGALTPGIPLSLSWSPKTKHYPVSLWFYGYNTVPTLQQDLYSFTPQTKPTVRFGAQLTRYTFPGTQNLVLAVHVENGFIWVVAVDMLNSQTHLYLLPAGGGGTGLRWQIINNSSPGPTTIQPVYLKTKSKEGVLPDQVWIRTLQNSFVIALNPSLDSHVNDNVCVITPSNNGLFMGQFSVNTAKADTGKKVVDLEMSLNSQTSTWVSSVNFIQSQPTNSVSREAITYTTSTEIISAIPIPNAQSSTKPLQFSCGTGAPVWSNSLCISAQWSTPFTGFYVNLSSPIMTNIDIVGYSDPKKFDLVFFQMGGDGFNPNTPSDPTISRIWGKYGKTAGASFADQADNSFQDESEDSNEPNETVEAKAAAFTLGDAYPNPFNPTTTIDFTLPSASTVTLKVYNMLGQEVARLIDNQSLASGAHDVVLDGSKLASGLYVYHIQAGQYSATKKLMLVK